MTRSRLIDWRRRASGSIEFIWYQESVSDAARSGAGVRVDVDHQAAVGNHPVHEDAKPTLMVDSTAAIDTPSTDYCAALVAIAGGAGLSASIHLTPETPVVDDLRPDNDFLAINRREGELDDDLVIHARPRHSDWAVMDEKPRCSSAWYAGEVASSKSFRGCRRAERHVGRRRHFSTSSHCFDLDAMSDPTCVQHALPDLSDRRHNILLPLMSLTLYAGGARSGRLCAAAQGTSTRTRRIGRRPVCRLAAGLVREMRPQPPSAAAGSMAARSPKVWTRAHGNRHSVRDRRHSHGSGIPSLGHCTSPRRHYRRRQPAPHEDIAAQLRLTSDDPIENAAAGRLGDNAAV